MPQKVIPLILSGGAGTRLWPVSSEERPKQFLRLGSKYSLIQETLLRCQGSAFAKRPIIIAAKSHYALIHEALAEIEIEADILLEPLRRDSCAAIVAGSLFALQRDSNALVMTVAADHRIPDAVAFNQAAIDAKKAAMQGRIVTFGIKPTHPATGYGYILPSLDIQPGAIAPIARFSEKPDQDTARRYIAEGCLWNSGNFLFKASAMLAEVTRYAPTAIAAVTVSLQNAVPWQKSLCLDAEAFAKAPKISIDFAVMEKTEKASVIAVDYAWSDIGTWDAVADLLPAQANGNVTKGLVAIIDGNNNVAYAENVVTGLVGVDDLVVVTTNTAVLVTKRGSGEDVKSLLAAINQQAFAIEEQSLEPKAANVITLASEADHALYQIHLAPGQQLSRRAASIGKTHWTILSGHATLRLANTEVTLESGQFLQGEPDQIYIIGNLSAFEVKMLESQTWLADSSPPNLR